MGRIERSFRLLGESLSVLRKDKELLVLPGVAFILQVAVAATFIAAAWRTGIGEPVPTLTTTHYLLLALFYFIAYFLSIFANAAVVACAMIRLNGGDPTIEDGLIAAGRRVKRILIWAAIAATVGLALRALEERLGRGGRILTAMAGVAWSVLTFFVVPVMVFEDARVGEAMTRSARLFKERWGETLTGTASVGLAIFILGLPFVPVVVGLAMQDKLAMAVGIAMVVFGGLGVLGAAVTGVYNAALYRYATTGEGGGPFTTGELQGTFQTRTAPMSQFFEQATGRPWPGAGPPPGTEPGGPSPQGPTPPPGPPPGPSAFPQFGPPDPPPNG